MKIGCECVNHRHPLHKCSLFRQKSTCITQLTLGPHVVQIWSRNVRKSERTKPANSTVWRDHSTRHVESRPFRWQRAPTVGNSLLPNCQVVEPFDFRGYQMRKPLYLSRTCQPADMPTCAMTTRALAIERYSTVVRLIVCLLIKTNCVFVNYLHPLPKCVMSTPALAIEPGAAGPLKHRNVPSRSP